MHRLILWRRKSLTDSCQLNASIHCHVCYTLYPVGVRFTRGHRHSRCSYKIPALRVIKSTSWGHLPVLLLLVDLTVQGQHQYWTSIASKTVYLYLCSKGQSPWTWAEVECFAIRFYTNCCSQLPSKGAVGFHPGGSFLLLLTDDQKDSVREGCKLGKTKKKQPKTATKRCCC